MTPWAQVLTDYMWNRRPANRPPMTTSILAAKLGINRTSVNTWIYRGAVPPIETILLVLAQLDIPLRTLYDAYSKAGLSVPRWDASDAEQPVIRRKETPQTSGGRRSRTQTRVPVPTNLGDFSASSASGASGASDNSEAPEPLPYTPPPPRDPAQENAEEWDRVIAQTSAALRAEGMPQATIEAVVASLRARQSGSTTTTQRHTRAEHSEDRRSPESPESPETPDETHDRDPEHRASPGAGSADAPSSPRTRGNRHTTAK